MRWFNWPAAIQIVPLAVLVAVGMRRDQFVPASEFFRGHVWRYSDIVGVGLVVAIADSVGRLPWFPRDSQFALTGLGAVSSLVVVGAIWFLVRVRCRTSMRALGLHNVRAPYYILWALHIVVAIAGVLFVFGGLVAQLNLPASHRLWWQWAPSPGSDLDGVLAEPAARYGAAAAFIYATTIGPLAEELYFRAFVLEPLQRKVGMRWSAGIAAGWWGTSHYWEFRGEDIGRTLALAAVGYLYIRLYRQSGSLVPSLTLHVSQNVAGFAGEFLAADGFETMFLLFGVALIAMWGVLQAVLRRVQPKEPSMRLRLF
jgi:membrane protease YdiL (CAAX protease family)